MLPNTRLSSSIYGLSFSIWDTFERQRIDDYIPYITDKLISFEDIMEDIVDEVSFCIRFDYVDNN